MELAIPQGDSLEPRLARVTKQLKDANGLPIGLANENPILDTRIYNMYLNMELAILQGDSLEPRLARVTKQLKDANGLPIGLANENPILDTRMYKVEYLDGE